MAAFIIILTRVVVVVLLLVVMVVQADYDIRITAMVVIIAPICLVMAEMVSVIRRPPERQAC